ncbi:LrgB family protein, partial [Staphylococcus warneri]|uniref:LrgB family protein n=1 Tax=Staphylococcus warneri TaxID=1292 RepID=UPI00164388D4
MTNIFQPTIIILLTILLYIIPTRLQHPYNNPFFNPPLISSILIIPILRIFPLTYKPYIKPPQSINHILNPTLLSFPYPLYQNTHNIKKYLFLIF